MLPPSECPSSAARSDPTASITARTSSMRSSSVGNPSVGTGSDRPVPRLSNRISRENEARRSRNLASPGSSHISSMLETHPGTYTRSNGPSPTTWYAMLRSPLRAYLVSERSTSPIAPRRAGGA